MRNKLKRSKSFKDTACLIKDRAQAPGVIVLSESSSSDDETSLAAKNKCVSRTPAGFSEKQAQPLQEKRKILCAKDVKIAPIFLRAVQHRSSDGELVQPVERTQKPVLPLQGDDVQLVKSLPAETHLTVKDGSKLSIQRGQLSPSALLSCLEEIQASNPAFPVRAVFSTLQKKASEGLQECESTEHSSYPSYLQNPPKEKRKGGNEISERVPKRLRSTLNAEGVAGKGQCDLSAQDIQESTVHPVKKQSRRSKLSRAHRLKQQSLSRVWTNDTESDSQFLQNSDRLQRVSCFEDVLWTDKYSPQHSREVIGNSAMVNKLHSWLKKWKLRAVCDERRKMDERKREENSNDSWDCGDFQGEAGSEDGGEEPLCNAMLITGPSGVGKTASVYACAQELGFKVFEVNCSSQRSGRHVLSQLREATQSHLVEMSGKDPLKPAYFNNYSTNSCTPKSETLPGKRELPKNVTSTSKKRAAGNLGCSGRKVKAKPATVTLAHYLKMKAKADYLHFDGLSPAEKADSKKLGKPSPGSDQTVQQIKETATSLILFEEVDVIFDDDVGFLAAVKAFMTTTKRPVILSTNDPSFKERFDCSLEEIIFKTPSAGNVCSYLQLVCLAESVRLDLDDVSRLLRLTCGDVRRCLLQLQLWVHSGGRWPSQSRCFSNTAACVQYSNAAEGGDSSDAQLPACETGCSADMLGLHSVTPNHLLDLLKSCCETDRKQLLKLLAESWRRGVPLLYSNLELLLSLGGSGISVHNMVTYSGLQSEPATSDSDLYIQQRNRNISPKLSATNGKSVRSTSRLSRKKYISTLFDTTSSSKLTHKHQRPSLALHRTPSRASSSAGKTEQSAATVTSDCLDALTDFFDLMSYADATLPAAWTFVVSGSHTPEAFVWTGAKLLDGLLDEMSEEEEEQGRSRSQERLLDIQAAVEGLGCHVCWWRVSEAQTEAQKNRQELEERLALSASSKKQSFSFSFQPLCAPSVSQRRYKLSRTVLRSKSFSLLGNRRAVSVDYMPVLRSICRSQLKEKPVRCLNNLSSTHLGLSKSTMQLLAEDFI